MNADELKEILKKHEMWVNGEDGGERSYLNGANINYFCLPLWCGSKGMIVDCKITAQIFAHACALECDHPDYMAARAALAAMEDE